MEEGGPEQGEQTVTAVPAGVLEPGDKTAGFSQPHRACCRASSRGGHGHGWQDPTSPTYRMAS